MTSSSEKWGMTSASKKGNLATVYNQPVGKMHCSSRNRHLQVMTESVLDLQMHDGDREGGLLSLLL